MAFVRSAGKSAGVVTIGGTETAHGPGREPATERHGREKRVKEQGAGQQCSGQRCSARLEGG
jgi:hypothetical protein